MEKQKVYTSDVLIQRPIDPALYRTGTKERHGLVDTIKTITLVNPNGSVRIKTSITPHS